MCGYKVERCVCLREVCELSHLGEMEMRLVHVTRAHRVPQKVVSSTVQ